MLKVLVLEDEPSIRSFIKKNLIKNGFEVIEASTGEEAVDKADQNEFAIALLDVMLPGIDGFEVCQLLRNKFPTLGIIMLTAKGQEIDKINGLGLGADDYVVKPFSPKELMARINSLVRRINTLAEKGTRKNSLSSGPFSINLDERRCYKADNEIELTPTEFDIIKLFVENPDKALSRDEILNEVWGKNYIGDIKVVDVNISRIRQKIEDNSSNPIYIEKVWGYGYRWLGGS